MLRKAVLLAAIYLFGTWSHAADARLVAVRKRKGLKQWRATACQCDLLKKGSDQPPATTAGRRPLIAVVECGTACMCCLTFELSGR